jgi:hypothetical protein
MSREYEIARHKAAKAAGLCSQCRKAVVLNGLTRCERCWFMTAANRNLGDSGLWEELIKLFKAQCGKCAYTGRTLTIGANTSIEHIMPRTRSNKSALDINNVKFVDTQVNVAKRSSTLPEFLQMCREVLVYFGYEITKGDKR